MGGSYRESAAPEPVVWCPVFVDPALVDAHSDPSAWSGVTRRPGELARQREVRVLPLGLKLRVLHDANAAPAAEDVYWLSRCVGFAVYDQDGRLGTVRYVRFAQTNGVPEGLVVRTGLFVRKLVLVPVGHVEEISPDQRRVLLRTQRGRTVVHTRRRPAAHRPRLGAARVSGST